MNRQKRRPGIALRPSGIAPPQRPGVPIRSQAYLNLTKEYGVTPSMSRRGNGYDNAMAENVSSIRKTERIYRHMPDSSADAGRLMDDDSFFHNHERIRMKRGAPPLPLMLTVSFSEASFCAVRTIWDCPKRPGLFDSAQHPRARRAGRLLSFSRKR